MNTVANDPWFWVPQRVPQARLRLLCLPPAGGDAAIYGAWVGFDPDVEIWALRMPGRGARMAEPALYRFDDVVTAITQAIQRQPGPPWALFGTSLGGLIGYEVARHVAPVHLFILGMAAPHTHAAVTSQVPSLEADIVKLLREVGTIPIELLDDPEFRELALGTVRADLAVSASYVHRPGTPLDCPTDVIRGRADTTVGRDQAQAWSGYTRGAYTYTEIAGGHMVAPEIQPELLALLRRRLSGVAA
jgi:surfactin synthase thioesterase subunit